MFVRERTVRTMASAWLASTAAVPGTTLQELPLLWDGFERATWHGKWMERRMEEAKVSEEGKGHASEKRWKVSVYVDVRVSCVYFVVPGVQVDRRNRPNKRTSDGRLHSTSISYSALYRPGHSHSICCQRWTY